MTRPQLPTIALRDVASRNNEESCYVSFGAKVYDITEFLDAHPGGGELILEYGGKDVSEIMSDESSHLHSDSAYEILKDHLVGFIADYKSDTAEPGQGKPLEILPLPPTESGIKLLSALSPVEGPMIKTDADADYRTHRFLDLNRPLLKQVWNGGFSKDFYLDQVHRPRYKLDSVQLFGNFLEPLTENSWYMIPICVVPCVVMGSYLAYTGLQSLFHALCYWLLGVSLWTFLEYGVHRYLFHIDKCKISTAYF